MTNEKKRTRREEGVRVDFGLGGLFKGVGNLLDLVSDMVEKGEDEVTRHGEFKVKDLDKARGVYGFSVRMGLGGVPTVEHFGNIRSTDEGAVVTKEREPLVDVFDEGELIVIVAELPGVDKDDVGIDIQDQTLSLSTTGERKYTKEILLPTPVDPATMETTYRNGILEVRLRKVG